MVGGGPSVLYDAVAIVAGDGRAPLSSRPARAPRTSSATPTTTASSSLTPRERPRCSRPPGVADSIDDGYHLVDAKASVTSFLAACRSLRHWTRAYAEPL